MWAGIDRRRFPRAVYPCKITICKKKDKASIATRTENIGVGGVCVILEKDLEIFSTVELEIDLENGLPSFKCDGTVVWVVKRAKFEKKKPNQFDIGIEFVDIKNDEKTRVEAIIDGILRREER